MMVAQNPQEVASQAASQRKSGQITRADADIFRRALSTFAELGYQATTVRELAKRLDVSHNFINDRYGSKENFWRAVIDSAMQDMATDLNTSFDTWLDEDDAETLRAVITRFFALAANSPQVNRIVADESVRDSSRLDYLVENYTRKFWDRLAPIIQRLMDDGRMPQVPLPLVFIAINGPALALTHENMINRLGSPAKETAEDVNRMAEFLAGMVVEGLLPSSRPKLA
jgi:TetR/AcrR family transcriptional regulator